MTTSPITANSDSELTRHTTHLSRGELAAACARNQHQVHDFLIRAIDASGLKQKELSARARINEATLSRLVRCPRNVEINTLSKIVYAACGATLTLSFSYPRKEKSHVILSMSDEMEIDSSEKRRFLYEIVYDSNAFGPVRASNSQKAFEKIGNLSSSAKHISEV